MPEFDSIPEFESIIGQQRPIRILAASLRKETIPHALLFTGVDGIGKRSTAMLFAMACNCLNLPYQEDLIKQSGPAFTDKASHSLPCGNCRPCKKIQAGSHPDVIHIQPIGDLIKIGQIRDLCQILSLKPYEARERVVIISDAQGMNPEASNALLKALEEPPDHTILILTAIQTSDLLPTIVSRCQHIRFNPISTDHLQNFLMEKHGISHDNAKILAGMANGSFAQALEMAETAWMNRRRYLIQALDLDRHEALSSKPIGVLLALADRLSKNREELFESLHVLKAWIRDLAIAKLNRQKMINSDMNEAIRHASRQLDIQELLSQFSAVETAEKEIRQNLNPRLIMEILVLRLSGCLSG